MWQKTYETNIAISNITAKIIGRKWGLIFITFKEFCFLFCFKEKKGGVLHRETHPLSLLTLLDVLQRLWLWYWINFTRLLYKVCHYYLIELNTEVSSIETDTCTYLKKKFLYKYLFLNMNNALAKQTNKLA